MRIVIPTFGRATVAQQSTLFSLYDHDIPAALLVDYSEYEEYSKVFGGYVEVIKTPEGLKGIGPKRDYAVQNLASDDGKICMMDDDLKFFVRREEDRTKFRNPTVEEMQQMILDIEDSLELYPLVGIASREGGHLNTEYEIENTRILRLLAYRADILQEEGIHFSDIPVMEDFHVALALLSRGYPNLLLNNYCHNQFGSGLKGGCSTWRTPQVQASAARKLKEMYPDFVTVVEKETKGSFGGGVRTDVRIQWKKAAEYGRADNASA